MNVNCLLFQYLCTALWSSTDFDGAPFDRDYSVTDFSEDAAKQAQADLDKFLEKCGDLTDGFKLDDVVHDFWLTRNHHGAGFWDGDYGDVGDELTKIAHAFGSVDVFPCDDGKLYFS
jgi:hypothetical protein